MSVLHTLLERWTRARLRGHSARVAIDPSTRLLRRFSVRFLARPATRRYVTAGANGVLNASIVFESVDGQVTIGDRCYIGAGTQIISRSSVTIGNDVTMAWGIMIYDHNSHSLDWRQRQKVVAHFHRTYGTPDCFDAIDWSGVGAAPIVIGDRVWIGFDAVILKGVTIGEGAIVGARSVVARDVKPYTVVAGNPAVVVRRLDPAAEEGSAHGAG